MQTQLRNRWARDILHFGNVVAINFLHFMEFRSPARQFGPIYGKSKFTIVMDIYLDKFVQFTERCFQFLALSLWTDSTLSHKSYENEFMKFHDFNWLFGLTDS